jgi:hypothetical protein
MLFAMIFVSCAVSYWQELRNIVAGIQLQIDLLMFEDDAVDKVQETHLSISNICSKVISSFWVQVIQSPQIVFCWRRQISFRVVQGGQELDPPLAPFILIEAA